jgi:glutathione synthase/RimK-type ligase-like ATP-grasp enzyme
MSSPVVPPRVLVITEKFDPHVDYVAGQFEKRGIPWLRFHMSEFPMSHSISLEIREDNRKVTLHNNAQSFDLTSVTAVWYRRSEPAGLPATLDPEQRSVARRECQLFFQNLWSVLGDRLWVSPLSSIREADNKAEQLLRASRYGFRTPPTLFTNDPDDVRRFYEQHGGAGKVIYKPHDTIMIPHETKPEVGVVYTTRLNDEHLERISEITPAPGIFQPYIEKDFEVRVTVVGTAVFACAIRSQEMAATRVDWRAWDWMSGIDGMPPHEPYELSHAMRSACIALVQSYGLKFAAIDFIVTRSSEWIFLELNPNGQWVWIEEMTGMPMSEHLVSLLLEGEQSH